MDTAEKSALTVSPATFSLAPKTLGEAMELAKLIADSELAPKDYKGKPGNVLIAVQMGREVGLSPMAAIQNIAVINGRPGIFGDAGKAILLAHGVIIEEDDVQIIKKTGMGRCRITRPGRPPVERTFSRDDAKAAGLLGKQGPWTNYTERQMAWRAFWFAARDAASDLLKGLGGAEELRDVEPKDITPMSQQIANTPAYEQSAFDKNLPAWKKVIAAGTKTPDDIIATVSSKYTLSDEQKKTIRDLDPKPATIENGESGKPAVTFAAVEEKLRKAKDRDLLDAEADLIGEVADPQQRAELSALYEERKAEFAAAA